MKFVVLTLFPEMFSGPLDFSIIKRAQEKNAVEIEYVNIRDFALDKHKSVDDHPYGGGQGMVLKVDVIDRALASIKDRVKNPFTILLDPRGKTYTQTIAKNLIQQETIILLCGHYEGIDERVRSFVDMTISIGDYVVTGGEIPAMMIIDSVVRLLPGVLKVQNATTDESFTDGLLEYPQYTRPETYHGMSVPPVLLSGNPREITAWKRKQQTTLTKLHREDLLK